LHGFVGDLFAAHGTRIVVFNPISYTVSVEIMSFVARKVSDEIIRGVFFHTDAALGHSSIYFRVKGFLDKALSNDFSYSFTSFSNWLGSLSLLDEVFDGKAGAREAKNNENKSHGVSNRVKVN
jgi:hypothetical protein